MDILDLYRYLFDDENVCDCLYEEKHDDNCKCDIIDIAEEEMKNIDSSDIDLEFEKVATSEFTKKIIDLVAAGKCTKVDIDDYLKFLNDDDILDLRVSGQYIFVKTKKSIIPVTLSIIMHLDEEFIEPVPINGRYMFYLINTKECISTEEEESFLYDPQELIKLLKSIGSENSEYSDTYLFFKISDLINKVLKNKVPEIFDKCVGCDIEQSVIAITFSDFIPDAKKLIGNVLEIEPHCFIEVSTPTTTILLIDTRKWYLEGEWG